MNSPSFFSQHLVKTEETILSVEIQQLPFSPTAAAQHINPFFIDDGSHSKIHGKSWRSGFLPYAPHRELHNCETHPACPAPPSSGASPASII
jgi:hypothetical protein